MTGKQRRPSSAPAALLPTAVVLGLLVLAWAAATGPVRLLSPSGRTRTFGSPSPAPPSTGGPPTGTLREVTRDARLRLDLSWLGDLIAYTVLIGVCVGVFLGARQLWLHRWHPPERPVAVEFETLPDATVVHALSEDVEAQVAAVGEGSVRNGIVGCWLRLEQAVAAAGCPRVPAETSSEFVVRVLKSLDLDPRAAGTLAALYREARFSEHELGEDKRTAARTALLSLHEDLRTRGAVS